MAEVAEYRLSRLARMTRCAEAHQVWLVSLCRGRFAQCRQLGSRMLTNTCLPCGRDLGEHFAEPSSIEMTRPVGWYVILRDAGCAYNAASEGVSRNDSGYRTVDRFLVSVDCVRVRRCDCQTIP